MAIIYNIATKSARMQAVLDQINAGVSAGTLEIGDAGFSTVLVTIPLDSNAGVVTDNILTLSSFPKSDTNTVAGIAAEARIKDGDGVVVISGLTVGTVNSDITLDSVTVTSAGTVTIKQALIIHG